MLKYNFYVACWIFNKLAFYIVLTQKYLYKIFLYYKNMENEIGKTFDGHVILKQIKTSQNTQGLWHC